jgi:hypothetical protein
MRSLKESLFDKDIMTDQIGTLYDWFGSHIKKFSNINSVGLGWTHYFDQPAVVREWKKEGRPTLSGGFSKTTFPPDLQKFIAVILNNIVISKKQLLELNEEGKLDDTKLNNFLDEKQILNQSDSKWGASDAYHTIGVRISYIDATPAGPGHGVQFRNVGLKAFKGFSTENIEITIYTVSKSGMWSHRWVLLTDLSIKNFKEK